MCVLDSEKIITHCSYCKFCLYNEYICMNRRVMFCCYSAHYRECRIDSSHTFHSYSTSFMVLLNVIMNQHNFISKRTFSVKKKS